MIEYRRNHLLSKLQDCGTIIPLLLATITPTSSHQRTASARGQTGNRVWAVFVNFRLKNSVQHYEYPPRELFEMAGVMFKLCYVFIKNLWLYINKPYLKRCVMCIFPCLNKAYFITLSVILTHVLLWDSPNHCATVPLIQTIIDLFQWENQFHSDILLSIQLNYFHSFESPHPI